MMKFAKVDNFGKHFVTGKLDGLTLCNSFQAAVDIHGSEEKIYPVLSRDEFNHTSKDYKGYKGGFPYVLYLENGGTTYGPALVVPSVPGVDKSQDVTCMNCGYHFTASPDKIYHDDLGKHTVCRKCDSSFDIA
jgi:hypothetical protein